MHQHEITVFDLRREHTELRLYVYLHADDEEMRQEWIRTENQMLLRKGSTKNESGL